MNQTIQNLIKSEHIEDNILGLMLIKDFEKYRTFIHVNLKRRSDSRTTVFVMSQFNICISPYFNLYCDIRSLNIRTITEYRKSNWQIIEI